MTDKEIFETEIKCINRRANGKCNGGTDCCKCDLLMDEKDIISAYERAIANSDLINRQHAEIERLRKETMNMAITIESCQGEAITEFAERLKEGAQMADCFDSYNMVVGTHFINDLLKEMIDE